MNHTLSIEDIISDYTPDAQFSVFLGGGEEIKFRAFQSHQQYREHQESVVSWFNTIPNPLPAGHVWEGLAPTNLQDAYHVFTISTLSIEPKITQLQAMKMLKAPLLIEHLSDQIEAGLKSVRSKAMAAAIEKAKKNSDPTVGEETNSPSVETPSENTPTS
jgi:hypothetical protein